MTVGQTGTKASIIRNQEAIYASSGAIGLGQQIAASIDGLDAKFHNQPCDSVIP
jgi:hypothetical protein